VYRFEMMKNAITITAIITAVIVSVTLVRLVGLLVVPDVGVLDTGQLLLLGDDAHLKGAG